MRQLEKGISCSVLYRNRSSQDEESSLVKGKSKRPIVEGGKVTKKNRP